MFNPAQVSSQLAKMSDTQLQSYAQMHRNDPYVIALALSESNRRQQLRSTATQMPQGEPPKVVDQEIAQMLQQQPSPEEVGIAQLPAGDMNFADGGIVGYAEGDLVRFKGQEYSVFVDPVTGEEKVIYGGVPTARSLLEGSKQSAFNRDTRLTAGASGMGSQEAADADSLTKRGSGVVAALKDTMTLPFRGVAGAAESVITRPLRAMGVPVPYLPDSFYGGDRSSMTPYTDTVQRQEDAQRAAAQGELAQDSARAAQAEAAKGIQQLVPKQPEAPPTTRGASSGIAAVRPVGLPAVDAAIINADRKKVDATEAAILAHKTPAYTGDAKEAELKKFEEKLRERREDNLNMALMQAGLAMMGTKSQYALQGIGEGAQSGLAAYASGKKDIRDLEKEIAKSKMDLADAREQGKIKQAESELQKLSTLGKLQGSVYEVSGRLQGVRETNAAHLMGIREHNAVLAQNGIRGERAERAQFFREGMKDIAAQINKLTDSTKALTPQGEAELKRLNNRFREYEQAWSAILGVRIAGNTLGLSDEQSALIKRNLN